MNKTLISIEELKQIALRKSTPGCEDVSAVGIYPVTDAAESNRSLQVVSGEGVDPQATNSIAIYPQHKFRREYNLLTGRAPHAGTNALVLSGRWFVRYFLCQCFKSFSCHASAFAAAASDAATRLR